MGKHSEALRVDNDTLMIENAQLRDRLSLFEGMAGLGEQQQQMGMMGAAGPGASFSSLGASLSSPPAGNGAISPHTRLLGGGGEGSPSLPPPAIYTASSAAYIELQELRKENAVLHERLTHHGETVLTPGVRARHLNGDGTGQTQKRSGSTGVLDMIDVMQTNRYHFTMTAHILINECIMTFNMF